MTEPLKTKQRKPSCVKKVYTEKEASMEVFVLCSEEHKNFFGKLMKWGQEYCEQHQGWHVVRLS